MEMEILDYGGGGGQFALVMKSLYPKSNCTIVDMNDIRLLKLMLQLTTRLSLLILKAVQRNLTSYL